MGVCFSKKKPSSSHHNPQPPPPLKPQLQPVPFSSAVAPLATEETALKAETVPKIHQVTEQEQQFVKASQDESLVQKEIFVIKHRKSHDRDKRSPTPPPNPPQSTENEPVSSASTEGGASNINATAVRTSSCTKEEVDAILIQCGRLSRSNSSGKTPSRKYSGSKRSYDFDCENDNDIASGAASTDNGLRKKGNEGLVDDYDRPRRRSPSRSSSKGRRRTPSREREQQQNRSGSRERGSGVGSSGGSRRVSRSPGRRSENSEGTTHAASGSTNRPGKMVSVPATVSSLVMDKSINGIEAATTTIKRISVKRNVSPARTTASPRSQSPARTNNNNTKGCNNENQQQPTLSRSSSRKAEHSPYRRNPLSEIDPNSLAYPHSAANKGQGGVKKSNGEMNHIAKAGTNVNGTAKETRMVEPNAGADNGKPQQLMRSRSSRRSRDLDLNPETLSNPVPSSYTSLLLEDIQNFHQKNNNPPPFSLPACISKACSIMEAVADLNSTTSSNLCDRKGFLPTDDSNNNHFVETEVTGNDHLMEPSFHKYVTVRRGGDLEDQESSGSNSVVGSGQQHWGISGSSSWEPNSADSTDRWTSRTKSNYNSPLGAQMHALVEPGNDTKKIRGLDQILSTQL